jgi:hypothetical protein
MPSISGSLSFNVSSYLPSLVSGDVLSFQLVSEYQPYSNDWTGSVSYGQLTIDLEPQVIGGYPYATSSINYGDFISGTISPNVLVFNSNISSFYQNYTQIPVFTSGSGENEVTIQNSLYNQYGNISEPFYLSFGDKIYMRSSDGRVQILTILNSELINNQLHVYVEPALINTFLLTPENISVFLIAKKVKDEQNIILQFKKAVGQTSYGFVISDDVDPKLIANISTIQTNVQTQLLSTQNDNSRPSNTLDLGNF